MVILSTVYPFHNVICKILIIILFMICLCSCAQQIALAMSVTSHSLESIPKYTYLPHNNKISHESDPSIISLGNIFNTSHGLFSNQERVILESWSLFLICNPAWLSGDKTVRIHDLYQQFKAFGKAIGQKHLAVWFWKSGRPNPSSFDKFLAEHINTPEQKKTAADIVAQALDIDRHVAYCERHGLLPGDSPHVLVTTTYPEEKILENKVVLRLANADAVEITELLTELTNQLLVEGLDQKAIDTEQYWQSWLRGLRTVSRPVTAFIERISITVDTKFVKAELKTR